MLPRDFEPVAGRLECDEYKGRFEAKLAKIAKVKPEQAPPKRRMRTAR